MALLKRLCAVLAVFIISLSAACYWVYIRPPALRAHVQGLLAQNLNARISLGSASVNPFAGIVLRGLRVSDLRGSGTLFQASRLRIRPSWSSLARLKFRIREIGLRNAEFVFTKDAHGRSNWSGVFRAPPVSAHTAAPVFTLENGSMTIEGLSLRGLACELIPFPSERTVAIRGALRDPFWGDYQVTGSIDQDTETLGVSFESRDLDVTAAWMEAFPVVGKIIWKRYRPAGLYDLMGTVSYCWAGARQPDFNLIFTAKNASCKYRIFPVSGATGRLFLDPRSVIINHLEGAVYGGKVEGYTICNFTPPCTYFNRYSFTGVDIAKILKGYGAAGAEASGKANGYVTFQGDHCMKTVQGRGEITMPDARLWKFPIIVNMLSMLRASYWTGAEPRQECKVVFTFSDEGVRYEEISLVSDVLDIYGEGRSSRDGALNLTFYVRPVSKTPIFLADILLQQALDSLSGTIAQVQVTGTLAKPRLSLIPLTPVSKKIAAFFDSLTRQRLMR